MHLVKRAAQAFGAGMSLSDFDRVLDQLYGGNPTYTGKLVSQQNSLGVGMVWTCVANTPFLTYRRENGGLDVATDHYLWPLLLEEANPELTAFRFKQLMQAWVMLWGNAFAEIQTNGRGQIIALWPWRPDSTQVSRGQSGFGPLEYRYKLKSGKVIGPVYAENMFHLRGFGTDGGVGLTWVSASSAFPALYHSVLR